MAQDWIEMSDEVRADLARLHEKFFGKESLTSEEREALEEEKESLEDEIAVLEEKLHALERRLEGQGLGWETKREEAALALRAHGYDPKGRVAAYFDEGTGESYG